MTAPEPPILDDFEVTVTLARGRDEARETRSFSSIIDGQASRLAASSATAPPQTPRPQGDDLGRLVALRAEVDKIVADMHDERQALLNPDLRLGQTLRQYGARLQKAMDASQAGGER